MDRYFLLLIVISAMGAGGWVAWQNLFKESPTPSFRESLRCPSIRLNGLHAREVTIPTR